MKLIFYSEFLNLRSGEDLSTNYQEADFLVHSVFLSHQVEFLVIVLCVSDIVNKRRDSYFSYTNHDSGRSRGVFLAREIAIFWERILSFIISFRAFRFFTYLAFLILHEYKMLLTKVNMITNNVISSYSHCELKILRRKPASAVVPSRVKILGRHAMILPVTTHITAAKKTI